MAKPTKADKAAQKLATERAALRSVFTDTCLLGCHGIVHENVRRQLGELLRLLGRPDLAAITADIEQLLKE